MKTAYKYFCKLEEIVVQVFLCAIMILVFISALMRTFGTPINWAVDLSLLLFAWLIFLGADVALRSTGLVAFDMFFKKFPKLLQDVLFIIWTLLSVTFLGVLVRFGLPLAIENYDRPFITLGISFSYATIAVPIGAFFMIISIVIKFVQHFRKKGAYIQGA